MPGREDSNSCFSQHNAAPDHVRPSCSAFSDLVSLNANSHTHPQQQDQEHHRREHTNQQDVHPVTVADTPTAGGCSAFGRAFVDTSESCPPASSPVAGPQEVSIEAEDPPMGTGREFSCLHASLPSNADLVKEDLTSPPTQMHSCQGSTTTVSTNIVEKKERGNPCRIGLLALGVTNALVVVGVVAIVCIFPFFIAHRRTLDFALLKVGDVSSELISGPVGSNLFFLEETVTSIFTSLQINHTVPLYRWTGEHMPKVMQQLCGIFLASRLRRKLLYLHVSSPYSGFGAYCSQQYDDNETLVGTYNNAPDPEYRYVIDPKTLLYAEPREPVYMVNRMSEADYTINFAKPHNVLSNVVLPCYSGYNCNPWWIFAHNNEVILTYTYPFFDHNNNPAMVTGALQLNGLRSFNGKPTFPVELDSSIVFDLKTGLILSQRPDVRPPTRWDNWNCTHSQALCRDTVRVEYLESLSNRHMSAAVEKLGGKEGITLLLTSGNRVGYSFDFEGTSYHTVVSRVYTHDDRLFIVSITLVQVSALGYDMGAICNTVLLAVFFSLFAIAFAEIAVIYTFLKSLHPLRCGFSMIMQLRDGSEFLKGSSSVKEVAWLRRQLREFNVRLMYMKTFIPTEVTEQLVQKSDDTNNQGLTAQEIVQNICSLQQTVGNTITAATALCVPDSNNNDCLSLHSDGSDACSLRTNGSLPIDEINQFHQRFCSVVYLTLLLRDGDHSIDDLVRDFSYSCIPLIMRYSGVIEVQRPTFLLVTFGAHSQMARHQTQAVRFALELLQQLSHDMVERVGVMVDSSEYLVGTCGTAECNTRAIHGLYAPVELDVVKFILSLKCHIVVTWPVAIALDKQFLTIPVEAVCCGSAETLRVLYELRGCTTALGTACMSDAMEHIATIRRAFLKMLAGKYAEAALLLLHVEGKDVQADRLLRVCRRCMRKKTTKPYVRTWGQVLDSTLRQKGIKSTNNCADASLVLPDDFHLSMLRRRHSFIQEGVELGNTVLSGVSARSASTGATKPALCGVSETIGDGKCLDRPLFEMFMESSTDDSDDGRDVCASISQENARSMPPTLRSNAKGELPFVFTDHQGNTWMRSVDKLGAGASSVVYRGMSSLGDLVALKCFALRARHIYIADIVEELKLFSQLRHGNIVQYISCYFSSDYLIEVMELVPGGSLDGILSSFGVLSTVTVRRFLRDALNGLMYLHSKNVIHCDLKPHNALVAMGGVYKLTDFGSSLLRLTNSLHEISDVYEMRGTPGYMAPEVARGELPTAKSDVFSLGITVLELLTGKLQWDYAWEQEEKAEATQNSEHQNHQDEQQPCSTDTKRREREQEDIKESNTADRDVEQTGSSTWLPEHNSLPWQNSGMESETTVDNLVQTTRLPIDELLRNPEQLVISVGKGEVVPVIPQWLENDVQDFLGLCVALDPEKRATAKELMQHSWLF